MTRRLNTAVARSDRATPNPSPLSWGKQAAARLIRHPDARYVGWIIAAAVGALVSMSFGDHLLLAAYGVGR